MRIGTARKLEEDEIQDRLAEYARKPDPRIRDEVVLQYGNLVESIGRRFVGACEPLEDLVQEGYIGLIASVDKYDADKGVKFSTYATHFIIGQIKHYLRDKGKIIKEPAWLQELNQKMTRVIESLNQKFGRQPTEKEIGEVMQMPEQTVNELLTTREVFKVSSLDGGTDKDDDSNHPDTEKISDQKLVSFQLPLEDKIVLETAMQRLKDIEQQVIFEHFYRGHNQTEIAKMFGISCNYVSHILRNGTKKLKKILTTEEIRDTQMQRTLVSQRIKPGSEPSDVLSVIDPITEVYNRQYFEQRLDEEISRAYRSKDEMVVLLLNIVLPEEVDNYTRMVRMDDLLYTTAQSMKKRVRKMDVLARFGEMSFGLILPHTEASADKVAERLTGIVSSISIGTGGRNSGLTLELQIGKALYPKDAANSRDMLKCAAANMGVELNELEGYGEQDMEQAA